jgi:hypothetical protein
MRDKQSTIGISVLLALLLTSSLRAAGPLLDARFVSRAAKPHIAANNVTRVRDKLLDATQQQPLDEAQWARLAWVWLALDDAVKARYCTERALRIRPYHSRYKLLLAHVMLIQGKPQTVAATLAGALQSSADFFNHIKREQISNLIGAITDPAARQSIAAEFDELIKTDTFAGDSHRSDIMARAAKYGRVLQTWREPDNKLRLWIAVENSFLLLYDEADDSLTDMSVSASALGYDRLTVQHFVIIGRQIRVAANNYLLLYNRTTGDWHVQDTPTTKAVAGFDGAFVKFRSPDGAIQKFLLYQGLWVGVPDQPDTKRKVDEWAAYANAYEVARSKQPRLSLPAFEEIAATNRAPTPTPRTYARSKQPQLSLTALADISAANGAPKQQPRDYETGMALPTWSRQTLDGNTLKKALAGIASTGIGWVSYCPTGYQHGPRSTEIVLDPVWSMTPEDTRVMIRCARKAGLKVLLKPHINLAIEAKDNHMWRGLIEPAADDIDAWFVNYEAFLMPYVDIAIAEQVEMLSVGVELKRMTQYDWNWHALIERVQKRGYKGKLTYAALHNNYYNVRFWDALDFIGIDAYFGATKNSDAGLDEIMAGYSAWANRIEQYVVTQDKEVIFTEVGFNNQDGVNCRPWYWSGNPASLDNIEQAACYHAVLEVFPRREWMAGMFWWEWSVGGPPAADAPHYSPQSKLAVQILKAYLTKPIPAGR